MRSWTDEQLIEAVKTSNKYVDIAIKLGFTNFGSNYNTIKKYIKLLNLDTSHFLTRKEMTKLGRSKRKIFSHEELFCVNKIDRQHIKKTIIKEKLIEYKCNRCGINDWEGEELSLHLDHINGINNDNRLENLRFLCPNCHSLTDSYCARNIKYNSETKQQKLCELCQAPITFNAILCKSCNHKNRKTKIEWPEDNLLLEMFLSSNYTALGKELGVSGNAIKKRLHTRRLLV